MSTAPFTIIEVSIGGGTVCSLTAKTKSDSIRVAGSIVGTSIKSAAIVRDDQGTLIAAIGWRESLRRAGVEFRTLPA